jgi:A/G-specific adenine glycosylase
MYVSLHIIAWQRLHGRHQLPWQNTHDPYRIWLSEIMLHQTQVPTVVPYYARFLQRFPNLTTLAAATQEDMMPYWAGLGYYARARNLHRCAQEIVHHWDGHFPATAAQIATLPGIGRSTAAAIAAFAYGHRCAILDSNVKRVFTRYFGIIGDPSRRVIEQALWDLAEVHIKTVATEDIAAYTQGLMDLGATVCTRSKPACERCPLQTCCIARRDGRQKELPTPKARKTIPERQTGMLVVQNRGAILLHSRPSPGIWGGLWSLPEFDARTDPNMAARALGLLPIQTHALPAFAHTFTHYRLHAQPWYIAVRSRAARTHSAPTRWMRAEDLPTAALPTPVKKLLQGLFCAEPPS